MSSPLPFNTVLEVLANALTTRKGNKRCRDGEEAIFKKDMTVYIENLKGLTKKILLELTSYYIARLQDARLIYKSPSLSYIRVPAMTK